MTMKFANQRSNSSYRKQVIVGLLLLLCLAGLGPAQSESARELPARSALAVGDEDAEPSPAKTFSCLPRDVRADEAVSYPMNGKPILTVEKKLAEMKARCRRGRLVDGRGREIRFFRSSCWGNPPPDYLEIRQRENEELAKLKKRYPVFVFGGNPMIQ